MRRVLYLTNKYSNNPGNKALLNGTIKQINQLIGDHYYEIFDLDKLSYNTITEQKFVDLCNSYQYCIVAGPIIFNGQIHYNRTGSKINISLSKLKEIKSKFILLGVSTRIWPLIKYYHLDKLIQFLEFIENQRNWFFYIRDDGSLNTLNNLLSLNLKIPKVADPALFAFEEKKRSENDNNIGLFVNLNGEDFKNRFGDKHETFLREITITIQDLMINGDYEKLVLQPHGPDDLEILSTLSNSLSPKIRHKHLEFGSLPREYGWESVYNKYRYECKNLITMRIHSLSPCIAMGIGTHIIYSSQRIKYLAGILVEKNQFTCFDDPNLVERIKNGFPNKELIEKSLNRISLMKKETLKTISEFI